MKVGTRSILFGAHAFWLHPWFVAWAWWKLYGFPFQLWLWAIFFVHDIGYVGMPNMDGAEGQEHPWLGARIMYQLQAAWLFLQQPVLYSCKLTVPIRWWHLRRRYATAYLSMGDADTIWGNESLYHSRFLCAQYGAKPTRVCFADKLSIALIPWWLYVPMTRATGEIREYCTIDKHHNDVDRSFPGDKFRVVNHTFTEHKAWFLRLQKHAASIVRSGNIDAP